MLRLLKSWKLASVLKHRRRSQEAFAAVVELGQMGGDRAFGLLVKALSPPDDVARSAARELGRMGDGRAVRPLAALLGQPAVNVAAAEALVRLGPSSVDALQAALRHEHCEARRLAAWALGQIGDTRAVESLAEALQGDPEFEVRTTAARSLAELKDARAVWALVATLKLRDETSPERQAALEELRQAASLALHKIGDPLAKSTSTGAQPAKAEQAVAALEKQVTDEATLHPRLAGDLSYLTEAELVQVLKELIAASEEVSWANMERREPLLPAWFKTYDQRQQAAEAIGDELKRRGGSTLLRELLRRELNDHATLKNWWHLDVAA